MKLRNRFAGASSGWREKLTESIQLRTPMNRNTTRKEAPTAMMSFVRSFFAYRRTRASSSSLRTISRLLLHVPDHEDEAELRDGDHQPDDDVQQGEDEASLVLADEPHVRHDADQDQVQVDADAHELLDEQRD